MIRSITFATVMLRGFLASPGIAPRQPFSKKSPLNEMLRLVLKGGARPIVNVFH